MPNLYIVWFLQVATHPEELQVYEHRSQQVLVGSRKDEIHLVMKAVFLAENYIREEELQQKNCLEEKIQKLTPYTIMHVND